MVTTLDELKLSIMAPGAPFVTAYGTMMLAVLLAGKISKLLNSKFSRSH